MHLKVTARTQYGYVGVVIMTVCSPSIAVTSSTDVTDDSEVDSTPLGK